MDKRIALACLLIAGGALGLALPLIGGEDRLSRDYSQPPEWSEQRVSGATEQLAVIQDSSLQWSTDDVTLARESDGHFYADVRVDGRDFRMLVDTGASVVALTGADASAMGLYWDDAEVAPIAQGAGGAVEGVRTTIQRMTLGEHEVRDVSAMIIPEGLGISLLGQSFLSSLGKVEITGDQMVLGD